MLFIAPGDAVATPRSRRSEHGSAPADFIATAQRGERANVAQPLSEPCFEDSLAGQAMFLAIMLISLLVAAWQLGCPA
jgi:hypothetical protein